ncbi:hypothetical protein A2U01_0068065, partial [Trifolium medium]|nr:hypothetical protein [Trifolium medium]
CSVSRQVSSDEPKSSASGNNDWQNWVAMQGNNQMAVDDVWGLGKLSGLSLRETVRIYSRSSLGREKVRRSIQACSRGKVLDGRLGARFVAVLLRGGCF